MAVFTTLYSFACSLLGTLSGSSALHCNKEITTFLFAFGLADTMYFFTLATSKESQADNVFVNRLTTQLLQRCLDHLSGLCLYALLHSPRIHLYMTACFRDNRYRRSHRFNDKNRIRTLRARRTDMASVFSSYAGSHGASNASSEKHRRSTPTTSNEEQRVGPSRAHFQKYYHEIKPLAAGAHGETFLAIPRRKADPICANIGSYGLQQFFDALRAEVVVVKFPKARRGTDELANEIEFVAHVLPVEEDASIEVPITRMIDFHETKGSPWLALGFAKGGDLYSFIRHNPKDLTLGMRWHLGLKLAKAIAYLHYGETDLSGHLDDVGGDSWPLLFHGDFHTGNILLTSSSEGSYRDYPDLKLADFGRTMQYVEPKSSKPAASTGGSSLRFVGDLPSFKQQQKVDFRSAGLILLGMTLIHHYGKVCFKPIHCNAHSNCGKCPRADCEDCVGTGKRVGRFEGLGQGERMFVAAVQDLRDLRGANAEHTRGERFAALKAFATMAKEQRDKHYAPLSEAAKTRLDTKKVTDEDINQALGLNI